jgi:hypothetical protein
VNLPTSGVLDDRTINEILSHLKEAYGYVQSHKEVLSKIDGAKEILDTLGKVNMPKQVSVHVLRI